MICLSCRAEKDASSWSKDKLKSLLVGLKFSGPEGKALHIEVYTMCTMCMCVS